MQPACRLVDIVMKHASLTAKYRPQTFAEVTGQQMVKTILSRAAEQDKVAPAYLLSGTRGVGKTTIARIFAKALNCEQAPTAEPCNVCGQCRRIMQGSHVDVIEIDGASNRGIDDARRLREAIGYAPMEGRYKVFIIDEAHMLTKDAFNALLKTLEEPPARATFILATTEPHKFPITIISRCQHFVFQAQPEAELVEHLRAVLDKEGLRYEENAVRLLARRAQGSVRDAMSLMGQTLALGADELSEEVTRQVLGLAGMEAFEKLLHAIKAEDALTVAFICRELLERGVDIGFFLRELVLLWRNLFLLRQSGAKVAGLLDLPEAEQQRLLELAPLFELPFIHAAWHMVLESQRQVLTSLEPAAALELLLLNLSLLPRLLSLEQLSGHLEQAVPKAPVPQTAEPASKAPPTRVHTPPPSPEAEAAQAPAPAAAMPDNEPDWQGFLLACADLDEPDAALLRRVHLDKCEGVFSAQGLVLQAMADTHFEQLSSAACQKVVAKALEKYCGKTVPLRIDPPKNPYRSESEVKQELEQHPLIQDLKRHFDASILRCIPDSTK